MVITIQWTELRHRAISAFNGELPTAATEQDLIDAFEQEPLAVANLLDQIASDLAQGKARSGWAVWRSRAINVHARREAIATDDRDREVSVRLAEQWIRHAGGYLDRESEVLADLFGPQGRLRAWGTYEPATEHEPETFDGDEPLRDRMLRLWDEQRPRFEKTEADSIERQARQAELVKKLRTTMRTAAANIDLDQHAQHIAAEIERARTAAAASDRDIDWST